MERLEVAPDVAWTDLEDRVAVVRLSDPGGDPLVLAGSAAEVWRSVADGATRDDVVAAVAAAYDVGREVVETDVVALLDDALRAGILTAVRYRSHILDPPSTQ